MDKKELNSETLHKLNTLLGLCVNDNAMKLPISMRDYIWHNMTPVEVLSADPSWDTVTCESIRKMTASVINKMPNWLRYSVDGDIKRDVEYLLRNRSNLAFA